VRAERTLHRFVRVVGSALLVAGCAHKPPPSLHSARLIVDSSGGDVRPYVRAKVAGQPMKLLLDTGAFRSVIPYEFARANGLLRNARTTGDLLVDAHGNAVPMSVVPDVPVQFEGEATGGTLEFVINPTGANEGVLLPQDIVRPGFVLIIDLGHEELRYEAEESALKRFRDEASSALRELDYKGCINEGFFERGHRIVAASINGVSANMLVDTGASRTMLTRNNPALASMSERIGKIGATGAMHSVGKALMVPDVPIVVSQTSFRMPVLVNPQSSSCWQGAIGADLLRHCTLVWGWSSLWTACRAPDDGE